MLTIKPGEHGSTFGGNPIACKVAMAALKVIKDEKLDENAYIMGKRFREQIKKYTKDLPIVKEIRGKGLLNAIEIIDKNNNNMAWDICLRMSEYGLLAKPTHGNIIRFAPPLTIKKADLDRCISIIIKTLKEYNK